MGILSSSVSISQFRIIGTREDASTDLFDWASEGLRSYRFHSIDAVPEECAVGWVHIDDCNRYDFSTPSDFFRENFITMSLRQDRRCIPKVLLKAEKEKAERGFMKANPGYSRVPKEKKDEILAKIKHRLLAKVLPSPKTYDAVWDTGSNIVYFASISSKAIDLFMEHFIKTFKGLSLSLIHPYARAEMIVDDTLKEKLTRLNKASKDDTLSLINANLWIGWDFLKWIMFQTMNNSSEYKVYGSGHFSQGDTFVGFIDDRLVMVGEDERGIQKITVAGPQSHFSEVKTALKDKKKITESAILMEAEEEKWKFTLKGDSFYFSAFKSPAVKVEGKGYLKNKMEMEAVFYEKMYLIEKGMQLFNSLFYDFLQERLNSVWEKREEAIKRWINS